MTSILNRAAIVLMLGLMTGCAPGVFNKGSGLTANEAFSDNTSVATMVEAVRSGHFDEAESLINTGANVNAIGKDGISPLLWVMFETLGDLSKTEFMLKAGADPNYLPAGGDGDESAMFFATGGNRPEYLKLLLRYKGNPNLTGRKGNPLLEVAVMQRRKKQIQILLDAGADINNAGPRGLDSAPETAWAIGWAEIVPYFLERGYNHNLDGLARTVQNVVHRPSPEFQKVKETVIAMLRERGVAYPPVPVENKQALEYMKSLREQDPRFKNLPPIQW
jgi:hypothetical protein